MLIIILVTGIITARAQSSYTTIQYNNKMQPALVLELPYTTDDAEGTIVEKLKQNGYNPETRGHLFWKKDKTDGFYVFTDVMLPTLSSQKLDIYFKVVQKNNEEKNNSTLYLLVSSGNENFASPDDQDTTLWKSSVVFLNSFLEKTTAYSLEQEISTQENTINDARQKLTSLQSDESDLHEKIKKYQDELINNQERQRLQQEDIANKSRLLENMKLRRKG